MKFNKEVTEFNAKHNIDMAMLQAYVVNGINAQTAAKGYPGSVNTTKLATFISEALPVHFALEDINIVDGDLEIKFVNKSNPEKNIGIEIVIQHR